MKTGPVPFKKIVFVCINRRPEGEACCAARDAERLAEALKAKVKSLGMSGKIRVSKSGCQDVCAQGPNVMLFPEQRWYAGVTLSDVDHIVQDALEGLPPAASAVHPPHTPT